MIHAKPGQVWQCIQLQPGHEDYGEITRIILVLKEAHRLPNGSLYLYTRYRPDYDGDGVTRISYMNESPYARWERLT